jgi:hypothetical protein
MDSFSFLGGHAMLTLFLSEVLIIYLFIYRPTAVA